MKLEACTIAIRERSLTELFDLAIPVTLRHAWRLPLLALPGLVLLLPGWWLLRTTSDSDWHTVWLAWTWMVAVAPLGTAALSVYLGHALFERQPSLRTAFALAGARVLALVFLTLLRAVLAISLIGMLLWPLFWSECLLLERQGPGAAWTRGRQLAGADAGRTTGLMALTALLLAVGLPLVAYGLVELHGVIDTGVMMQHDLTGWLNPGRSVLPWLLAWVATIGLTVVRYLAYLDARTRREGWEVEVALRRAAVGMGVGE